MGMVVLVMINKEPVWLYSNSGVRHLGVPGDWYSRCGLVEFKRCTPEHRKPLHDCKQCKNLIEGKVFGRGRKVKITPYQKIRGAASIGCGVRLTAEDVFELGLCTLQGTCRYKPQFKIGLEFDDDEVDKKGH